MIVTILLSIAFIYLSGCNLGKKTTGPDDTITEDTSSYFHLDTITLPQVGLRHLNVLRYYNGTIYIGGESGTLLYGSPRSGFSHGRLQTVVSIWDVAVGSGNQFAFGGDGNIFRLTNTGIWDTIYHLSQHDFRRTAFDGSDRLWALSVNSTPSVAIPPYSVWNQYSAVGGTTVTNFTAINFHPPSSRGYLTSSSQCFRSYDNGITWSGGIPLKYLANDILFLNQDEMLLACNNGKIMRSYDFGLNWEFAQIDSKVEEQMNRVITLSSRLFLAVSGYYYTDDSTGVTSRRGRMWRSRDKQNWELLTDIPHNINDIAYSPLDGLYICGSEGFFALVTVR